jgi:hypothetical protein
MIKIRCGNCGQLIGVPEKFAGKRVLCPKCKGSLDIPQTPEGGNTNLIKFHCPHCNQKIGLPQKYAGKQVRCAKCKNPMQVPSDSSPLKPSPAPQKASPPADDFNPFTDLPGFNEPLQPKQDSAPADAPLQLSPLDEPSGSRLTDNAGRIPAAVSEDSHSKAASTGLHIDNTFIALLAGVIFVILGGMVWGLVAKYAGMELGLLAWGIGVLAGLGIYFFTSSRGTLLGIAASLIALFGILSGKYFVAKWHFMPQLMAELKNKDASSFIDANNIKLADKDIKQIMAEPGAMFALAAMQLADDGKITPEDADYYVMRKFNKTFGPKGQEQPDESASQEKQAKRQEVETQVYKCLAEWDEQKKVDVVRTQYPKAVKKFADVFAKSKVMNVVGFAIAYISAFSFFDLLWFPLAMVTAYKFGTGENS